MHVTPATGPETRLLAGRSDPSLARRAPAELHATEASGELKYGQKLASAKGWGR